MNITKSGPAGYDYQYLASLFTFLFFSKQRHISGVYIDMAGAGDLSLTANDFPGEKEVTFEFEYKDRDPGLDKAYFLKCVSKFNAYSNDKYILSKIGNSEIESFCLFTSSRAEQFAVEYGVIANNANWIKPAVKLAKKTIVGFKDAVIEYNNGETEREKFVTSHLSGLPVQDIGQILDRITIIDQLDYEIVLSRIHSLLTERSIALSQQGPLISTLIDIIKKSATSGINIVDPLNLQLDSKRSWLPPVSPSYILMGDENDLFDELHEHKLLFLTGSTQCGKTQRAYQIASMLLGKYPSMTYLPATEIDTAEQFLLNFEPEGKICYLEDPLGQYKGDFSKSVYKQLENLVRQLPKHLDRYLIVTATTEVFDSLAKSSYLKEFTWHDLTLKDASKSLDFWRSMTSGGLSLEPLIAKMTVEAIENAEGLDVLQPGQLAHLASVLPDKRPENIEEIKHLANFRAQDITDIVLTKGDDIVNAFLILGLGATTQTGLFTTDLSYVENTEAGYLPGINVFDTRATGGSIFDTIKKSYTIPLYKTFATSCTLLLAAVSQLIDQGYVRSTTDGAYVFSHPVYQEAARKLLSVSNPIRFERAIYYCEKLLGCLEPLVALQGVKNLNLLFNNATTKQHKHRIIELGAMASRSTFVVVRDEALLFQISHYSELEEEQSQSLKDLFEHRLDFGTQNYSWQGNTVFIPDVEFFTWDGERTYRSRKEILYDWDLYQKERPLLNARQAYRLLNSLEKISRTIKERLTYDCQALKVFLRYKEAIVRERAAYLFAACITEETISELKGIYFEDDPYIKFQLVRGLFKSWPYIRNAQKKAELFQFMQSTFDEPFVVLSAIPLFTQFSSGHVVKAFDWYYGVESSARKPMWFLWGSLMEVLFKHIPTNVHINGGRFMGTLEEAEISIEAKIKVITAYLGWLPGYFSDAERHADMAEGFLLFLGNNFARIPKTKRLAIINNVLAIKDDRFVASSFSLFLSKWEILTVREKKVLTTVLPALCELARLTAFTSSHATEEIQLAAAGYSITGSSTETIIAALPERVIIDALVAVYIEYPIRGFSNLNYAVFNPILEYYSDNPKEKPFAIVAKVFLEDVLIWNTTKDGMWEKPKEIFKKMLEAATTEAFNLLGSLLIHYLMTDRYTNSGAYLAMVFEYAPLEVQSAIREKICLNLESISYSDNFSTAAIYLTSTCVKETLYGDEAIKIMLDPMFYNADDEKTNRNFAKVTLVLLIANKVIRLHQSILRFRNWADRNRNYFIEGQLQQINDYLSDFHTMAHAQSEEMEQEVDRLFHNYLA